MPLWLKPFWLRPFCLSESNGESLSESLTKLIQLIKSLSESLIKLIENMIKSLGPIKLIRCLTKRRDK